MSSKVRRKLRDTLTGDEAIWNVKTIAALSVILVCFGLLLFGVVKLREARVNSLPQEFEGRIVEKHIGGTDSDDGSSHRYYRLLVEIDGQPRLSVPVNRDIYEQAQVGMVLKRTEKGLEVVRAPQLR